MSAVVDRCFTAPENCSDHPPLLDDGSLHLLVEDEEMEDEDDEEEASLSETKLSEEDCDNHGHGEECKECRDMAMDDHVSKCSMNSMSAFMSSLVGFHHNEDWSFCLQVDNAKPRDLPPPPPPTSSSAVSMTTSSSDSSSIVSISRKPPGISRWDSTPSRSKHSNGSSPTAVTADLTSVRPRAMRPWRHPNTGSSGNSNATATGSSTISSASRKVDMPISRPQRYDSNRSLNAKRPQRYDSNRDLNNGEMSFTDLVAITAAATNAHHQSSSGVGRPQDSMDLRVLLECDEDDDIVGRGGDDSEVGAVYVRFPSKMCDSGTSLWSSASTMTASIRTMTSTRSLMSHYSKESNRSLMSNGNLNNNNSGMARDVSNRSLFCKSEEEHPMRPPRRTRSRELHFRSNACERPVRRPVRAPSDRSMLDSGASSHESVTCTTNITASKSTTTAESTINNSHYYYNKSHKKVIGPSLLPALNLHESSGTISFRLLRSLSEQTMDTAWREQKRDDRERAGGGLNSSKEASKRVYKRTLSDSLLFKTNDDSVSSQEDLMCSDLFVEGHRPKQQEVDGQ